MVEAEKRVFLLSFHPSGAPEFGPLTAKSRVCGIAIQRHPCFYREQTKSGRAKSGLNDASFQIISPISLEVEKNGIQPKKGQKLVRIS